MIQTRLYTVSKNNNTGGNIIYASGSSSGASSSKSINVIEGNIENLTSQTIYVSDKITAKNANIDNILGDVINSSYISSYYIVSDDINTNSIFAYTTGTDKLNFSYWSINEDTNNNLLIHSEYDKQLSILPNNIDVLDVMSDKVKINKTLDLTNEIEGTNVYLGGQKLLENNTNIKSIEEQGFYICDANNNIALGISGNYVQAGADIGSPNFFSGVQGWRIQPDGTGEFQNLKVNGNLDVFVLTYNEMRATNGILLVTDAGCITDAISKLIDDVGYWIFTIDEFPPFAIDDYVQLQYRSDETRIFSFKGIVTAINQDGKNTVRVLPLSGFAGEGTSTDDRGVTTFRTVDTETCSGEYLIRIGNKTNVNRQTIIKLNPYDGGYIDFMKGLNSENALATNTDLPVATRLGNLTGVVYKGTKLNGYGLFSDNAYLTGAIKNLQNKWALNDDGSGNLAGEHITWDKYGNLDIRLGDKQLTTYFSELDERITTTYSYLSGYISATASGLTADYSSYFNTVQGNIDEVSGYLSSYYSTTEQMKSYVGVTVYGVTANINKTIDSTYAYLDGRITNTYTYLSGYISATASGLITDYSSYFNTVQGNIDEVSGYLSSYYSTTEEMKAYVGVTAYGLKSTVSKTIESTYAYVDGKVTTAYTKLSSQIEQTASYIKLELTDNLGQTGIDIENHKITINANNTDVVGNLNLYDKENGLTIYDDNNNKRVNISGKSIEDTTIQDNYTGEEKTASYNIANTSSIYNTNVEFNYTIYLSKGVNIIKSFKITQYLYYGSGTDLYSTTPHQNSIGELTLSCNGVQQKFNIYLAENIGDYYYYYCNDYFKLFSVENKTATLTIRVNTNNSLSSWTNRKNLNTYFNFIFEKFDTTCTHICNDGLYSMVTPRKFLKMDYNNFELSNCYNGIRVVDYCDDYKYSSSTGIEINAAKSDWEWGKPVWLSIFDYTPIYKFSTNETVQKKVTNMNETKYVFEIDPKKHRGLIIPSNIINSNDGNELYILLPKNRIYYENYSVPLTPGYTIRISSCLANKNIYVTPNSDGLHHGIIIDDNKDENYFTSINSSNGHTDTYIFLGSEKEIVDGVPTGLYIDRWLSMKDTQ